MKTSINIKKLLNRPNGLTEIFHQKTKIKKYTNIVLDASKWPQEWKTIQYKAYARLDTVDLPSPTNIIINRVKLGQALEDRKSARLFKKTLSIIEISTLLYYSAGLLQNKNLSDFHRFYPSAGARFPLELYLLSLRSELPKGLYHYYVRGHCLEILGGARCFGHKFNYKNYFMQDWISKSSVLILVSAIFKRNSIKYGDRGYRYVLIEAGHLGQNIYLLTTALGINCCAIGGFKDDALNKLLDLDGINESIIYVFAIG